METKEYFEPKINVNLHSKEIIRLIKSYGDECPRVVNKDTGFNCPMFATLTKAADSVFWKDNEELEKVDIQLLYAVYLHLKHLNNN